MPTRLIGVNIMTIISVSWGSGGDLVPIWCRSGGDLAQTPPHPRPAAGRVCVYENAHTASRFDPPPPPLLKNTAYHKILKNCED